MIAVKKRGRNLQELFTRVDLNIDVKSFSMKPLLLYQKLLTGNIG